MINDLNNSKKIGFLYVQCFRSSITHSSIQHFLSQIPDAARDAGTHKILVDARETEGTLGVIDRFEYASALSDSFRQLKVAFLLSDHLKDPELFGETVAINRGGNVRVFTEIEEARDWLAVGWDEPIINVPFPAPATNARLPAEANDKT